MSNQGYVTDRAQEYAQTVCDRAELMATSDGDVRKLIELMLTRAWTSGYLAGIERAITLNQDMIEQVRRGRA